MLSDAALAHEARLRDRQTNPPPVDPDVDPMTSARTIATWYKSWSSHPGTGTTAVDAGGVPGLWVDQPTSSTAQVLLYFHGGGYMIGSADHVANLVGHLVNRVGCRGLSLDYRLAPEHPFPAAVDDAVAAYRWLLGQGMGADQIVVSGDSAGGGLALALLLAAKDRGLPQPAGAALLSPWVDLRCSGPSYETNASTDLMVSQDALLGTGGLYAPDDLEHPLASPINGDFAGLAPLFFQCGGAETLVDDSFAAATRAARAGVDVRLECHPGMQHVFQYCVGKMPEADRAVDQLGAWLRDRLGSD